MSDLSGTVLWYRPTMGRGMVKADSGKRLFFGEAAEVDAVAGLRISFAIDTPTAGGPSEAAQLQLEGGVRNVLDPVEYLPQPKVKKRAAAKKKTGTAAKKKKAPARPKKKKKGEAMAVGTPVGHKEFGAGHVLSSTKAFVRVEFLSGEERSIPLADLEDVGGNRGAPAPTRRKRAPAKAAAAPEGRKSVTRKKAETD